MPSSAGPFRADWYPAPDDPAHVRYWDGHKWTEHVAPRDWGLTPYGAVAPPPGFTNLDGAAVGESARQGDTPDPRVPRSRVVAVAMLTTPVLGFFLPLVGLFASAGAALWAVGRAGPVLWGRGERPRGRRGVAALSFIALWLPALLQFVGVLHGLLGAEVSGRVGLTAWLIIPLAAPEDPLTPAAVAAVVYAIGAGASALRRRPWPWVVGGLAASAAYDLTIELASIGSIS